MRRILTGDRPTDSKFHLGNYVGTLKNRVQLQNEYETFVFIADLHMLTTHFENMQDIQKNIEGLMLNYLAVGLDYEKVTFFVQSHIPAIPQIALILGMITSVPFLERQPALKEKLDQGNQLTYGLLGYPVLMASDILSMNANLVPVGKDQKPHVEFARDIAQKFNGFYGNVLTIPEPLIGEAGTLVGTDGKAKMSKSLKNAIFLLDDEKTIREKVMKMYTDPTRIHATDPGHIEGNPIFIYHDFFNADKEEVKKLKESYERGGVSDKEVKEKLIAALVEFLSPIQERYTHFSKKNDLVEDILQEGNKKASAVAQQTLENIKKAMNL